ncbi:MAG: universal stress protein [Pseudomonadota bacterium]|nr:MAG: universal stress protein [Novosphingobium sp. SCN 66-18]
MKTVMLYVAEDARQAASYEAALTLVKALGAHLTCVQAAPFSAFVVTDPLGGIHPSVELLSNLEEQQDASRARVTSRLAEAGVDAEWVRDQGPPASVLLDHSRLSDLVILGHGSQEDRWNQSLELAGDLAVHSRAPVLSVPHASGGFAPSGVAAIAWNGSFEAAQAVRLAVPLLRLASSVRILTVADGNVAVPASAASTYLSRHSVQSEVLTLERGTGSVCERLLKALQEERAVYAVLGAYGHSRIRERLLGGVTRGMLLGSPIPLLLAH